MFWRHWTINILIIAACVFGEIYYDLITYVYNKDSTYLTFVIVSIFFISQLIIGKYIWLISKGKQFADNFTKRLWNMSETFMGFGIVGTLIGFLIVLSTSFQNIDGMSAEAIKNTVIANLAYGMGTALTTSLIGLICALILKYQITAIEMQNEK